MKTLQQVINENQIEIVIVSYDDTISTLGQEDGTRAYTELFLAGGARALITTEGVKRVEVIDDLAKFIGVERLNALIAHEVGHLILKHEAPILANGLAGFILEDELAADEYAASFSGKQVVSETIQGVLRWALLGAMQMNNNSFVEAVQENVKSSVIQQRLEALR